MLLLSEMTAHLNKPDTQKVLTHPSIDRHSKTHGVCIYRCLEKQAVFYETIRLAFYLLFKFASSFFQTFNASLAILA